MTAGVVLSSDAWGLGDLARADAAGADVYPFHLAVAHGANTLQVRIETAFGNIMCMADIIAYHRFFSAYFTHFSHDKVS